MFDRVDTDDDGVIGRAEAEAFAESVAARRRGGGKHGPGPGERPDGPPSSGPQPE